MFSDTWAFVIIVVCCCQNSRGGDPFRGFWSSLFDSIASFGGHTAGLVGALCSADKAVTEKTV